MLLQNAVKFNLAEFQEVWQQSVPEGMVTRLDQLKVRGAMAVATITQRGHVGYWVTRALYCHWIWSHFIFLATVSIRSRLYRQSATSFGTFLSPQWDPLGPWQWILPPAWCLAPCCVSVSTSTVVAQSTLFVWLWWAVVSLGGPSARVISPTSSPFSACCWNDLWKMPIRLNECRA